MAWVVLIIPRAPPAGASPASLCRFPDVQANVKAIFTLEHQAMRANRSNARVGNSHRTTCFNYLMILTA
ncbi:hypothetical protein EMIT047CA2_50338 [Pseudomonas soli]